MDAFVFTVPEGCNLAIQLKNMSLEIIAVGMLLSV